MMNPKGKKSPLVDRANLKVAPEVHQEINVESAKSGKPIYAIVEESWTLYKTALRSGIDRTTQTLGENDTSEPPNPGDIIQAVATLKSIIRSAEAALGKISPGRSSGTHSSSAGEDDELDAALREVEAEAKKVRQAAKRTGGPGGKIRDRSA